MSEGYPLLQAGELTVEQEVECLRQTVIQLCDRLAALELEVTSLRQARALPASSPASAARSPPSSPAAATGSALTAERLAAAKDIGRWIVRCLNSELRGLSGRERIPQASRLYLIVRNFAGEIFDPPLVRTSWRDTSALVSPQGQPGDSIYVGLPTKEEARLAVREAGLTVPPALLRA